MPEAAPAVSAIIFDLDGTLIDSREVMEHAYYTAYAEVVGDGSPPPFSQYVRYMGQSFANIMIKMGLPLDMYPVFKRESLSNMHRVQMFDRVPQMLNELVRRGVRLAIATGKDHARAQAVLEHLRVDQYFSVVIGSDDVARQKPAPDMANQILSTLGLHPRKAMFVGDAVADLECGREAGVWTALALWGNPPAEVLAQHADFRFSDPHDLLCLT